MFPEIQGFQAVTSSKIGMIKCFTNPMLDLYDKICLR